MLPGKLCIGILEEDNPLKSYFRLKPLLVEAEGKYIAYEGAERYPEEGCIRIVPDKNESSHFKARMRRMGRYCVLDLREHTGESDKIRPNKNYHGDETERNAHIIYSDVVREPAPDMIFETLREDAVEGEWSGEAPGTPRLLKAESLELWSYAAPQEEEGAGAIAPEGAQLEKAQLQFFSLPGFDGQALSFAIRLPGCMPSVTAAPQTPARAEKAAPAEASAPEEKPSQPSAKEEKPSQPSAKEEKPSQPSAKEEKPSQPSAKEEKPAAEPEKPWISHDLPAPPPPRGKLSPLQQALAAQSGLNPRRNRSLQEIIEEKWRHSRVDQLGHPVPAKATGQPVESPLERALDALRGAWRIPEIHDRLIDAISEMKDFALAVDERHRALSDSELRRELEDLEAERLRSLDALDKLRQQKEELRETFKKEIRQEEAEALRDAVERTRAAREECAREQAAAEAARQASDEARDAFAALNDGRFEERLREFALTSRAARLLSAPSGEIQAQAPVATVAPSREEWLERARQALILEGLRPSNIAAAELLVCAALGDSLLLSGPAASDKRGYARALARALGAMDAQRYADTGGAELPEKLRADSPLPAVLVVSEANDAPGARVDRGLCGAAQDLIVISILAEGGAGFPVSAEALERGFFLRLEGEDSASPWKPAAPGARSFPPATLAQLREALLSNPAELPVALERRLQKLRTALARHGVRLSRRTLDLMWRYCGAMLSLAKISAGEALDLAFARKALPCILAEAPVECLIELEKLLSGMPHSLDLLRAPLPIQI